MTQGDKELLLRYLSMALPYRVFCSMGLDYPLSLQRLFIDKSDGILLDFYEDGKDYQVYLSEVKPYLRPMSSMTEEEEKEFNEQMYKAKPYSDGKSYNVYEVIGWDINYLNAHHLDYFGLIEKGLAIGVTEDNNPYQIAEEQI